MPTSRYLRGDPFFPQHIEFLCPAVGLCILPRVQLLARLMRRVSAVRIYDTTTDLVDGHYLRCPIVKTLPLLHNKTPNLAFLEERFVFGPVNIQPVPIEDRYRR